MAHILDIFGVLEDPRAANARHDLLDILFIALAATLCGAKNCAEMALFGRTREADLCEVLDLEHGVPSHDTFSKVFRHLNPEVFEEVFAEFMDVFGRAVQARGVVAIDGKQLRRVYEKGRSCAPQMMVSAWGTEMRMVLACRAAPEGGEVAATLELLRLVDLKGSLVTTDALHCRRDTAAAILGKGADYVLALKGNQPTLQRAVQQLLAEPPVPDSAETRERSHGRAERRKAVVRTAPGLAKALGFPELSAVGQITGTRTLQGRLRPRPGSFCSPARSHPLNFCAPCGRIGTLKTVSTGPLMWCLTKTSPAPEKATGPAISPSCAASPSIAEAPTPTKAPSRVNPNAPDWITASSSPSSPICDSPGQGGGCILTVGVC